MEKHERRDSPNASRRQRRKDGEGVNVAFIQDPKDNVNSYDSGQNQERFISQGRFECMRGTLKCRFDAARQAYLFGGLADMINRGAERCARRKIERQRDHWKLRLMIDRDGGGDRNSSGKRAERGLRNGRSSGEGGVGSSQGDSGSKILRGGANLHINVPERVRIGLPLRTSLQHHVILVGLREDGRDLPLAEGIVERVVHVLESDAQPAGSV